MNGFEIFPIVSFLVLVLLISGKIFSLKRNGISVNVATSQTDKSKKQLYFIFLPIAILWLYELAQPAFRLEFQFLPTTMNSVLIEHLFLKIFGILIVVLAIVILGVTLVHFKTSLRFGLNEKQSGKLITTGIFSISRNPFFLSLDLYFLGIAMLLPSLFFICFALLAAVGIHFFILKEEKFMLKVYGEEYEKYSKKVSRYF
jgi:protein-S-isoprenylcysteine O-methyltransferase Ste14